MCQNVIRARYSKQDIGYVQNLNYALTDFACEKYIVQT